MKTSHYIVITRPRAESRKFTHELEKSGYHVFPYPSIVISQAALSAESKKYLSQLSSFDWILFTSRNGVRFFLQSLREEHIALSSLRHVKIGAVGPKTAGEVEKYHLPVHVIPSQFTTENLADELTDLKEKRILLPRADIATPVLTKHLEAKGAIVINIPIYQTAYVAVPNKKFENLLRNNRIQAMVFTSPSTINGVMKHMENSPMKEKIRSVPVFSIGPVTTESAKRHGFMTVYTAEKHTTEGLLMKIRESIL